MSQSPIKAMEGKEGWLFLANDTNMSDLQLIGRKTHAPGVLDAWRAELTERVYKIERLLSSEYLFMVAPNKESVHPEYLPDDLRPASHRPIHSLIEKISDLTHVYYPIEDLRKWSILFDVYPKLDTHWTEFGGFCIARALAHKLNGVAVPSLDQCNVSVQRRSGDLGSKFTPVRMGDWTYAEPRSTVSKTIFDNRLVNNGRMIISEKPGPIESRGLVFGDSFFYAVLPFLQEAVDRLVFVHAYSVDYKLVSHERPSFVISESVERFLIESPTFAESFSAAEQIQKKMSGLLDDDRCAIELKCKALLERSPGDRIYADYHRPRL